MASENGTTHQAGLAAPFFEIEAADDARPAAPTASPSPRAFIDRLPRQRDGRGNRQSATAVYHDPYSEAPGVARSGLEDVLREVEKHRPARAKWLEDFFNSRVVPAVVRFRSAREEADAELARYNARATAVNDKIEAEQARIRTEAEAIIRPHEHRLEAAIDTLDHLQRDAAIKVGSVGRAYNPDAPDEQVVGHVEPLSLAELAGRSNIPLWDFDQKDLLPAWLVWILTAFIGAMMGLSFGIIGGFLEPDELARQWVTVTALAILGLGPAAFSRKAIFLFHRQTAERGYRELQMSRRWGFLVGALAFDLSILAIDVVLEREGLLKLGQMSAGITGLSGQAAPEQGTPIVWYIVPLAITLGYVGYSAWEGYLRGRRGILANQLVAIQAESYRADRDAHLARVEVQAAISAVIAVKMTLHTIRTGQGRIERLNQPFLDRIAQLETGRLPIVDAPTPEQCARIQDALDNLLGADLVFLGELRFELELLEPTTVWHRRRWPWNRRQVNNRRTQ